MATKRRTSQRGFATMDPERRRRIARKGGLASQGGSRRYEEDYNQGYGSEYDDYDDYDQPTGEYDEGYEEEDDYGQQGRRYQGQRRTGIGQMQQGGYDDEGYFDDEDYYEDEDEFEYDRPYAYSEDEEDFGSQRRGRSRRGFGGMSRRRTNAGSGSYYGGGSQYGGSSYGENRNSGQRRYGSWNNGGSGSWNNGGSSSWGKSRSGNTSNRGFASMDPDKQRRISSKGGRSSNRRRRSR